MNYTECRSTTVVLLFLFINWKHKTKHLVELRLQCWSSSSQLPLLWDPHVKQDSEIASRCCRAQVPVLGVRTMRTMRTGLRESGASKGGYRKRVLVYIDRSQESCRSAVSGTVLVTLLSFSWWSLRSTGVRLVLV